MTLYLGLTLLLVTLVFSLEDSAVVDGKFLAWKSTTSLAPVMFATLGAGLIGGWGVFDAKTANQERRRQEVNHNPMIP